MQGIEIRGFTKGGWTEVKPPEWFVQATASGEDWMTAFESYGVRIIEDFDFEDSIEVYKASDGTYCIIFWESTEALAAVFISSVFDYLQFRAQIIAPNVQLTMTSGQLA
jgi:hypothetical protein